MYPLPAKEILNVHVFVDQASDVKLQIFDIIGNIVYTTNSSAGKGYYNSEIDVTGFASGAYIIKLSQDNTIKDVQKIMVAN
jgi:hypothetical protein